MTLQGHQDNVQTPARGVEALLVPIGLHFTPELHAVGS